MRAKIVTSFQIDLVITSSRPLRCGDVSVWIELGSYSLYMSCHHIVQSSLADTKKKKSAYRSLLLRRGWRWKCSFKHWYHWRSWSDTPHNETSCGICIGETLPIESRDGVVNHYASMSLIEGSHVVKSSRNGSCSTLYHRAIPCGLWNLCFGAEKQCNMIGFSRFGSRTEADRLGLKFSTTTTYEKKDLIWNACEYIY